MTAAPHSAARPSPTPLLNLPDLAASAAVGKVLVKCETQRVLGNFKSLGGRVAGLRALERNPALRLLICASDGNHGLAVASAAQAANAGARVYLPASVPVLRAERIRAFGAEVVRVDGSYEAAVAAAAAAATRGEGQLIPDTTQVLDDPVVAEVMQGYQVITTELRAQFAASNVRPTHLIVQAGVGGLAAALVAGLAEQLTGPPTTLVVEPEACACVGLALASGRPELVRGDLQTCAEMLSCGMASAPAVRLLLTHKARAMTVTESQLAAAPSILRKFGGPPSTPSGAAGLAGLLAIADDAAWRGALGLGADSIVLLVATESALSPA